MALEQAWGGFIRIRFGFGTGKRAVSLVYILYLQKNLANAFQFGVGLVLEPKMHFNLGLLKQVLEPKLNMHKVLEPLVLEPFGSAHPVSISLTIA